MSGAISFRDRKDRTWKEFLDRLLSIAEGMRLNFTSMVFQVYGVAILLSRFDTRRRERRWFGTGNLDEKSWQVA